MKVNNLVNHVSVNITPFRRANFFSDTSPPYHGKRTFRVRLKARSAGTFNFCAYAREEASDAPPPFTEAHAFAAFRVAR